MRGLVFSVLVLALTGCAMVQSDYVIAPATVRDCAENSVAYHLPRTRVEVTVESYLTTPRRNVLTVGQSTKTQTDNRWTFCLETIGNPFSRDQIGVELNGGLLARVFTDADDKSIEIFEKVGAAVVDGIVGEKKGRVDLTAAQIEKNKLTFGPYYVDPFSRFEMGALNRTLEPLGYCLHLEPEGDPYVPASMPDLCGLPFAAEPRPIADNIADLRAEQILPPQPWGVLYRPLLTHQLRVLRRKDPGLPTPWRLAKRHFVHLPNAAPIFGVEVERAAFTRRKTQLTFKDGVLADSTIDKGSELNELVSLPLTLAQLIVSLPAEVLRVRLANTDAQADLVEANIALLDKIAELDAARDQSELTRDELERLERELGRLNILSGGDRQSPGRFATTVTQMCEVVRRDFSLAVDAHAECERELLQCRTPTQLDLCLDEFKKNWGLGG